MLRGMLFVSAAELPALILPNWPAIDGVHAAFTTRAGGVSAPPWDSLNLGTHVGDDPAHVATNRARFAQALNALDGGSIAVTPQFVQQVHGWDVGCLPLAPDAAQAVDACVDACISDQPGWACTIMVADCLPIVFAHRSAGVVGAAHAGWRGLAGNAQGQGVVEQVWQAYCTQVRRQEGHGCATAAELAAATQVWLGPCIGPAAFEVGDEVRAAFIAAQPSAHACFIPTGQRGKWWADLPGLARQRWQALGVDAIYGNDASAAWCTAGNPLRFFSHRRDAGALGSTGRMAVAIWRSR